jgi:hypothetical protein
MPLTAEQQQKQDEAKRQAFIKKAGDELFDMMAYELPEELKKRAVFPKCPHCKRRPTLLKRKALEFHVQLRPYGPQTVRIDGYEMLPCCNALYDERRRITEMSRRQIRSQRELISQQAGEHKHGTSTRVTRN